MTAQSDLPYEQQDLVYRLLKRAEIRRQIATRKSVQEGKPDRLSDLLEEAAQALKDKDQYIRSLQQDNIELRRQIGSTQA